MSTSSWLADALLGSPIPPPNWLDPRHRKDGWIPPSGWVSPGFYSRFSTSVSPEEIRAELAEINSCVNPPVVQGWAWCLAIAGLVAAMLGLRSLATSPVFELPGLILLFAPLPLWFIAVTVGAFLSHDVELHDGVVFVRRWSDVWFGLAGKRVGPREDIHAVLSCGSHLQLASDTRVVVASMAMWPSSSRSALEERFDNWGIELEFPGRHHVHHPAHWNHGRHRVAHRMPDRRRTD
jgi:hypothetical protein